jgi:hypothetical protein
MQKYHRNFILFNDAIQADTITHQATPYRCATSVRTLTSLLTYSLLFMKRGLQYLKELAGVWIKDSRRYARACGPETATNGDPLWVHLHNRIEQIEVNPQGPGVRCLWEHSSRLHACEILPHWGSRLLKRVQQDWSFSFASHNLSSGRTPQVSFVFAHAGRDRLPQLCQVIRSAFAQRNVAIECIVVDLTKDSILSELPQGTIGQHVDTSHLPEGWYKSWAYNIGARMARGDILVFQDGDIVMPDRYAAELVRTYQSGTWNAASLQRFLFYLSQPATEHFIRTNSPDYDAPVAISQNWKGGTISIRRESFFDIGGFDEGFVGWGGEDDEFYSRCISAGHCRFGYIPFIHLWHPPQTVRKTSANPNIEIVTPARLALPVEQRIKQLRSRKYGSLLQPDPLISYKCSHASPASFEHTHLINK